MTRGNERWAVVSAAIAAGLAGAIHLALTPEHFGEGVVFGVAFLAMALFQVGLATALVFRPGPLAYRAGIWGSGLIIATYLATRVLPPPTAGAPEEITALGVAATTFELVALLLLVVALPGSEERHGRVPAWLSGVLVGGATPVGWVFVSGALQWTQEAAGSGPGLGWYEGRLGPLLPAVYGYVTDQLYLFLPWWAAAAALLLGILAGANVWLAVRLGRERSISCLRQRVGLLGLLPAVFAAPVCCGVPLAAAFGLSTATLFAAAPFATGAAILALGGNLIWLGRSRPAMSECDSPLD